jgi:hypothetical protein
MAEQDKAGQSTPNQDGGRTNNGWNIFGFEIKRQQQNQPVQGEQQLKSFVIPQNDDGAVTIQTGGYFGTYVDLEGVVRNEVELITRYREMAMQAELESAIDQIVNEAIVIDDSGLAVQLDPDKLDESPKIKDRLCEEFDGVLKLLNFGNMGHDIFKRWYIDGRIFYHVIIDDTKPQEGIKELRYIDPRRIRKIREIQKTKDPKTGADIIKSVREYYLYNERGVIGAHSNMGVRISPDAIVNVNSGLMDSRRAMVLSYLHKAIKPLNQLRMVEDATVIYRMSRAPDRRVFYIDVGTLPKAKAEQYMKDIMTKYRNKIVYDSTTGEVRTDRQHLSMLEDFWLPRREGNKTTEIETLPGGENLGKMEDVEYFRKKLYQSLSIPISRLDPQPTGIGIGRVAEVTRDELTFTRFVQRLRNKFAILFDDIMRVQLVLKGVCTAQEWDEFREDIWYDFIKDNNINEMKEAEVLSQRLSLLQLVTPFVGTYFSVDWVRKHVLMQTEKEIGELDKQMDTEKEQEVPGALGVTAAEQQAQDAQAEMAQNSQDQGQQEDEQNQATDQAFSKLKMEAKKPQTINILKETLGKRRENV